MREHTTCPACGTRLNREGRRPDTCGACGVSVCPYCGAGRDHTVANRRTGCKHFVTELVGSMSDGTSAVDHDMEDLHGLLFGGESEPLMDYEDPIASDDDDRDFVSLPFGLEGGKDADARLREEAGWDAAALLPDKVIAYWTADIDGIIRDGATVYSERDFARARFSELRSRMIRLRQTKRNPDLQRELEAGDHSGRRPDSERL